MLTIIGSVQFDPSEGITIYLKTGDDETYLDLDLNEAQILLKQLKAALKSCANFARNGAK